MNALLKKKHPCSHLLQSTSTHTRRQVINQLKSGVSTSLIVEKLCTGTQEDVLFNILKGRSFNFCCALRTLEEDSPVLCSADPIFFSAADLPL